MNEPAQDLHVACHRSAVSNTDIAFTAERLSPPLSDHWILYLETDQVAISITRVVPSALGHVIDVSGVLGMLFPARVTTVQVEVAPGTAAAQRWRFWVDDQVGK
jgi:hypothetical protein